MPFRAHLHTVNRHRRMVRHYCLKLGLVWQGLTHDLSKYSPTEFWRSAKYYQGFRSPNDQERRENGVSISWLHHKGRNRHHFEYWIDYRIAPDGTVSMGGCKMPKKYVAEMVIDRICASKNYQKEKYNDSSALVYYMNGRGAMLVDEETDFLAIYLLTILSEKGEEYLLRYMKKVLLKHKNRDYHVRDGKLILD